MPARSIRAVVWPMPMSLPAVMLTLPTLRPPIV